MKNTDVEHTDPSYIDAPPTRKDGSKTKYGRHTIQLAETLRHDNISVEQPRPGLTLFLSDCTLPRDIVCPYVVSTAAIFFSCMLSGHNWHLDAGNRKKKAWEVRGPCDGTILFRNCSGETHNRGGVPHRSVTIMLELDMFRDLIQESDQFGFLLKSLDKPDGAHPLDMQPSSPQTQLLASQLLNCRLSGLCRDLFMESKALELTALSLDRLTRKELPNSIPLSKGDIEKLHEAKSILIENMVDPPTIQKLARRVGLNEYKLKKGFREIFGCTVYETLRTQRMYTARTLLLEADMTASTAAATVGYTNLSHFIAAFRSQFGTTPGSLLYQSRRNHHIS